MGAAVLIGAWQYGAREDGRKADKNSIRIGVLLYRGDDTFIGTLRTGHFCNCYNSHDLSSFD